MSKHVFITGANGFVGRHAVEYFLKQGWRVSVLSRTAENLPKNMTFYTFPEDFEAAPWQDALENVDVVLHLAARAHVLKETAQDPVAAFWRLNQGFTAVLGAAAAKCGVKQFVYLSSAGVYGKKSGVIPFREAEDTPMPHNAYTASKLAGEDTLWQIMEETGLPVTVIRPPLMYGTGVRANFARLTSLVQKGIPLPFAKGQNSRSFLAIENLLDFIKTACLNKKAYGQVFNVSDGEDLSTHQLCQKLASALGKKPFFMPFPRIVARALLTVLGKKNLYYGLWRSFQLDISKAEEQLNWKPRQSVHVGLKNYIENLLNPPA